MVPAEERNSRSGKQKRPRKTGRPLLRGSAKGADGNANDFSNGPQPLTLSIQRYKFYGEFLSKVDDNTIRQKLAGKNIYEVTFKNKGGLVTPLIIQWTYKDGTTEIEKIPAEVWRLNENQITKVFIKDKEVTNILFDPNFELADVNMINNAFPKNTESKFDRFKKKN